MPPKSSCLHTNRLILKAIGPEDADQVMDILFHPSVGKTYMLPHVSCREETRPVFERIMQLSCREDRFVYGIYLQDSLIGWINETEVKWPEIEVGYVIHPSCQNQGYATEALQCAIAELFRIGFTRVRAGFFSENLPSRRVMEKSGMHPTGETVEIPYRGELHTCVLYEILCDASDGHPA